LQRHLARPAAGRGSRASRSATGVVVAPANSDRKTHPCLRVSLSRWIPSSRRPRAPLVAGDALGALKRVSLREDPPALALRGIAMAQLGEHARARELLKRAARGFGAHEELSRARCVVAQAEVELAMRDIGGSPRPLAAASAALEARADRANALQARLIAVRRLLLLGRIDEAGAALGALDAREMAPSLQAVAALAAAEVALRSLRTAEARTALARAAEAAERAQVPCASSRSGRGARRARSTGRAPPSR
jgi:tetratricopeptide (TPR) repeat protein